MSLPARILPLGRRLAILAICGTSPSHAVGLITRDAESCFLAFDPSEEASINTLLGPFATERLALTDGGHIRYALKTPYRDGTTHVIFEPLDFVDRLAALVPKPRAHLTRYHGVFAANSRLRTLRRGACGSSPASKIPPSSNGFSITTRPGRRRSVSFRSDRAQYRLGTVVSTGGLARAHAALSRTPQFRRP